MTFLFGFVGGALCVGGTTSPPDPILDTPPFAACAVPPAVPGRNGARCEAGPRAKAAGEGLGVEGAIVVGWLRGLRPRI